MDGWTDGDILEALRVWIEDLNDLDGEALIIVEGRRDLEALVAIGVRTPAVALNQGKELFDLLDSLSSTSLEGSPTTGLRPLVILTDWDRKGGQLASRIGKACTHLGIPNDTEMRRRLVFLTGRYIRTVESLDSLISRLGGKG